MDSGRGSTTSTRAHTDASLDAERASTDGASARVAGRARQALDDLIERDRLRADEGLARDRQRATALVEEQQSQRARHEGRRHDTDQQLSAERQAADATAVALREAEHALADAETQDARRSDVFGMVTHDIRSPLTVIAMNASIIADGTAEAETREAAQDIVLAAARMDRLLRDLLDVARIEANTFRIDRQPHDVSALLSEVHRSYRALFEARGMSFVHERPSTPLVVSFDHDRIVQVLANLLANAMKFLGPGGKVELRAVSTGGHVEIVVSDDGPGIAPDDVPCVFRRFWKLDRDERRGLGLGLYICEQIVTAHHGRIWVESDVGKGSTFRFTLPAGP